MFLSLGEAEPMETSVDLCNVLTSGAKFCRHCDTAVQTNMVKKKKSDLESMLTKSEMNETHDELYFCDENCYFQFAIGRADLAEPEVKDVKNLEELVEFQEKQKEIIKKEAEGEKEDDTPKHKGETYKNYSTALLKANKKFKVTYHQIQLVSRFFLG